MILCDTGALLCLVDKSQPLHPAYKDKIASLKEPLITTWACLAEVMHLALGRGGWPMQKKLSEFIVADIVRLHDILPASYVRLFQVMETYNDRPMDLADATLVLAAEHLAEKRILTTDSDFLFYPINSTESFNVVEVG